MRLGPKEMTIKWKAGKTRPFSSSAAISMSFWLSHFPKGNLTDNRFIKIVSKFLSANFKLKNYWSRNCLNWYYISYFEWYLTLLGL